MRRDTEYITQRRLEIKFPGERRRGRSQRLLVKEEIELFGVKEEQAGDRVRWR